MLHSMVIQKLTFISRGGSAENHPRKSWLLGCSHRCLLIVFSGDMSAIDPVSRRKIEYPGISDENKFYL